MHQGDELFYDLAIGLDFGCIGHLGDDVIKVQVLTIEVSFHPVRFCGSFVSFIKPMFCVTIPLIPMEYKIVRATFVTEFDFSHCLLLYFSGGFDDKIFGVVSDDLTSTVLKSGLATETYYAPCVN